MMTVSNRFRQQNKNSEHTAHFLADSVAAILYTYFESIFKTNNMTVFFVMGKNVRCFIWFFVLVVRRKDLNKKKKKKNWF